MGEKKSRDDQIPYPKLAEAVQAGLQRKGLGIQHVADAVGVGYEMARRYFRGYARPRPEKVKLLADVIGMRLDRLNAILTEPDRAAYATIGDADNDDEVVYVKESRMKLSAGAGHEISYELVEETEPATYRLSWLRKRGIDPKKALRFRVVGDSMEPKFSHGETVLINTAETSIVDGKVYAIRYANELLLKRLTRRPDGTLVITSDNPDKARFPQEELKPALAADLVSIIGKFRERVGDAGEE